MRSTRSCSRARRSRERGYALIVAIVLAVLYFGLIELVLIDSARELEAARRFRARVVAETLAENAAELAALQIVNRDAAVPFEVDTEQGKLRGRMTKNQAAFEIEGEGVTSGITEARAKVLLRGRVVGNQVRIQYSIHE